MPKKRSVKPGFTKALQRTYKRAAAGPSLPPEETPDKPQAPATAGAGTPKTHIDMARLIAAQKKRQRKAARNLART